MVSLTTHIKSEIRVVLFTELRSGREHTAVHTLPVDKGDSVIVRELKAILLGLEHMNFPTEIEIYTGNKWVVTALNEWMKQWQQDNWAKANKKPIKNKELWKKIAEELSKHNYRAYLKDGTK